MNSDYFNLENNQIDPTAIIEPGAVIGKGNTIGPFTLIRSCVKIGNNNYIGPHVIMGEPAEYKVHPEGKEDTRVIIGNRNRISEFTDIQSGILTEATEIGDDCYIMVKTHIAHDCKIKNNVSIAGGVILCGFVTLNEGCRIGPNSTILQRHSVGRYSQIGIGSIITEDVPEFQTWVNFTRAKYLEPNHYQIERIKLKENEEK